MFFGNSQSAKTQCMYACTISTRTVPGHFIIARIVYNTVYIANNKNFLSALKFKQVSEFLIFLRP